jgi:hypothetical protein
LTRAPVGASTDSPSISNVAAVHDDVELLLTGFAEQGLVMLVDDDDAARRAERRHAERGDVERAADVEALPPVVRRSGGESCRGLELVELGEGVLVLDCSWHRILLCRYS